MSNLGRRERLAKRKVKEAERQLALARKDAIVKLSKGLLSLPKRERLMLLGVQHEGAALTASNLKGHTHYAGAYVGRSPGVGNKDKLTKERRKHQGDRFLPAFMALGHEKLKTEGTKEEFSEVKLPPNKRFIRSDKL